MQSLTSNYDAPPSKPNVEYHASSRAHHFKPALLSQQSWIHCKACFFRRIFPLSKRMGTFWNCRHCKLSWRAWHCVRWRVALTLTSSSVSSNASRSAPCASVRWCHWVPFLSFYPWEPRTLHSGRTIICKHYVSAMAIVM